MGEGKRRGSEWEKERDRERGGYCRRYVHVPYEVSYALGNIYTEEELNGIKWWCVYSCSTLEENIAILYI